MSEAISARVNGSIRTGYWSRRSPAGRAMPSELIVRVGASLCSGLSTHIRCSITAEDRRLQVIHGKRTCSEPSLRFVQGAQVRGHRSGGRKICKHIDDRLVTAEAQFINGHLSHERLAERQNRFNDFHVIPRNGRHTHQSFECVCH